MPEEVQLDFLVNGQSVELNLTKVPKDIDSQDVENIAVFVGERGRITEWQTPNASQVSGLQITLVALVDLITVNYRQRPQLPPILNH